MPSRYTKGCSRTGLLAILALHLLGGFTHVHASPYGPVYQDAPAPEHVSSTAAAVVVEHPASTAPMVHETTTAAAEMVHDTVTTTAMVHETATEAAVSVSVVVSTETETVHAVETVHQVETVHVVESVPVTERVTEHVTIHMTETVQQHVTELMTVRILRDWSR